MFVSRNELGHIIGLFSNQQFDGQEFVAGAELWVQQPDSVQQIKDQITSIERDTMLNRAIREGWLLLVENEAMREFSADRLTVQAGLYSGNLAYRKVKDVDNQIVALRAHQEVTH